MAKKRRTREQKIIAQLRRQLASQKLLITKKEKQEYQGSKLEKKLQTKTELQEKSFPVKEAKKIKKEALLDHNELFFYDPSLIKKDLLKTVVFSFVILILIGLFYWGIDFNGVKFIREFLHL